MHLSDTLKSQITAENTDVAKVFNFQKKTIQNETYIVAKLVWIWSLSNKIVKCWCFCSFVANKVKNDI